MVSPRFLRLIPRLGLLLCLLGGASAGRPLAQQPAEHEPRRREVPRPEPEPVPRVKGVVTCGGAPVGGITVVGVWTPDPETPPSAWATSAGRGFPEERFPCGIDELGRFDNAAVRSMTPRCTSDGAGRFDLSLSVAGAWWLIAKGPRSPITAAPVALGIVDAGGVDAVELSLPAGNVRGRLPEMAPPEFVGSTEQLCVRLVPRDLWARVMPERLSVDAGRQTRLPTGPPRFCGGAIAWPQVMPWDPAVYLQPDAAFEFRHVPDGDYILSVTAQDSPWVTRSVQVHGGAPVQLGALTPDSVQQVTLQAALPSERNPDVVRWDRPADVFTFRPYLVQAERNLEQWRHARMDTGDGWTLSFRRPPGEGPPGNGPLRVDGWGTAPVRGDGRCVVALPVGTWQVRLEYRWILGAVPPDWIRFPAEGAAPFDAHWPVHSIRIGTDGSVSPGVLDWRSIRPPWQAR